MDKKQADNQLVQISASVPKWLKDAIQKDAEKERRSFSAQVALTLEKEYNAKRPG